jgi:transitional endoplasmic reticulum ATPase
MRIMQAMRTVKSQNQPQWFNKLVNLWEGGVDHAFGLHFNVHDFIPGGIPEEIRISEWLIDQLLERFRMVVYYDIARGFQMITPSLRKEKPGSKEYKEEQEQLNKLAANAAHAVQVSWPPKNTEEAMKIIEQALRLSPKEQPIAILFGYAETMFEENPNPSDELKRNVTRLIQWARSKDFEKHMIIIMANNSAKLAANLRSSASEFEFIKIPLPSVEEREAFIRSVPPCADSADPKELAKHASGLSLADIRDIIRLSCHQNQPLTVDVVWAKKRDILENATAGLLRVVRPRWTPDCIGGLKEARDAFDPLITAVRSGDILSVPMGVLVMGPPGTGKSAWAEILAGLLGYTMVELGNIKNPFVGVTEANQSYAYEYVESMAPVVVVRDEFDQTSLNRNVPQGLDAGVSEAMRARDMQFMARQDLRGKVIWVCISNLPGLIDAAYMRPGRLDLRIPFLPPLDDAERMDIYRAIFAKMKLQDPNFKHSVSDAELETIARKSMIPQPARLITEDYGIPKEFQPAVDSLTGAEIERICGWAWQMGGAKEGTLTAAHILAALDDFIPDRPAQYIDMFMQTIRFTNFRSLLPKAYQELIGNHH